MDIATRHRWTKRFQAECLEKGLEWIEDTWDRPTGTTRGVLIGPKDAQQSKVIGFLHGLGNDALFPMVGFFRHLLVAGWSIATCDIDGHGLGNTSTLDPSIVATSADGLVDFIAVHRPGRDRIHCAGYSFGAALMLDYANRNPERIHSLTMIGMPLELTTRLPVLTEASSIFQPSLLNSFVEYGAIGMLPAFGPVNRGNYPIRMADRNNHLYLPQARSIFANLKLDHALRVATFPCLFIGSKRDFIGPLHQVINLQLPIERLQIYQMADETHFTSVLSPLAWKRMEIFLRTIRNYQ